jgi:succinate-acetate transporter protein
LKNTKISIFGGISKFFKLIVFGQISTNFGSFGQIWANFVALAVADSMPELHIASHLKATNGLYLHFKFQVHWRIIASTAACPKQQKAKTYSIDV